MPTPETATPVHPSGPPALDLVRIGGSATHFPGDADQARLCFQQFQALHFTQLLEPAFVETLVRLMPTITYEMCPESFTDDVHQVFYKTPGAREIESEPRRIGRILNFAINRPEFLRWLEAVTGCDQLSGVFGRLVQTTTAPGQELRWHDDRPGFENRMLAVVINLSTDPYEGGDFALRKKAGSEVLFEHRYTRLGSALIFQVHETLEHRVKPLTSGGPRRMFAGWAIGVESGK